MPRKKTSSPPKYRKVGASHKNQTVNNWAESKLDEAWEIRDEMMRTHGKVNISEIYRLTGIPVTTLWKRFNYTVTGRGHKSGGKRTPKVLSVGKFIIFRLTTEYI